MVKIMADISMCLHKDCPKARECYRFNAPITKYYQSYMEFKNICNETNNYKHFYDRQVPERKDECERKC